MNGVKGEELEEAVAERIGDERHRWVAIEFRCQGEVGSHYQILDVHHNVTKLDAESMAVLDDIGNGWDLTVQEAMGMQMP